MLFDPTTEVRLAKVRSHEMLTTVQRQRQVSYLAALNQPPSRRRLSQIRQRAGTTVIKMGERLQGPASEAVPASAPSE